MKYMYLGVGVAGVLLVAVLAYLFFAAPAAAPVVDETPNVGTAPDLAPPYIQANSLTHEFEDGVHTISGVVVLPTRCHRIVTDTVIAESFPEQVTITISVPEDDGVCVQAIDERVFTTDVEVSRGASVVLRTQSQTLAVPQLPAEESEE